MTQEVLDEHDVYKVVVVVHRGWRRMVSGMYKHPDHEGSQDLEGAYSRCEESRLEFELEVQDQEVSETRARVADLDRDVESLKKKSKESPTSRVYGSDVSPVFQEGADVVFYSVSKGDFEIATVERLPSAVTAGHVTVTGNRLVDVANVFDKPPAGWWVQEVLEGALKGWWIWSSTDGRHGYVSVLRDWNRGDDPTGHDAKRRYIEAVCACHRARRAVNLAAAAQKGFRGEPV